MNKRLFVLSAVLVLASMVLAACGGKAAPASSSVPAAPLISSTPNEPDWDVKFQSKQSEKGFEVVAWSKDGSDIHLEWSDTTVDLQNAIPATIEGKHSVSSALEIISRGKKVICPDVVSLSKPPIGAFLYCIFE